VFLNIIFTGRNTKNPGALNIDIYSSDPGTTNFFIELDPGEYLLNQVVPGTGKSIDIPKLAKEEHREFFVEEGKLTYVGSWIFSAGKLEVTDEKVTQDEYMKSNFKYVSTSIAQSSLP